MRDNFPVRTKEIIAKRVNFLCSNPSCKKQTTGPCKTKNKFINVGVASHISAASKGGCRYNSAMSSEERKSAENGIWLCQTCSKLIDSDEVLYSVELLHKWKEETEIAAEKAISNNQIYKENSSNKNEILKKLEEKMPELFSEMRNDLVQFPFRREFVISSKNRRYTAKGNELAYWFEEHPELRGKLQILQNHNLISEITYNNAERFIISEELAEYLTN